MTSKSISQQIYDEFIEELSKNSVMDKKLVDSLKTLIQSGNPKKNDFVLLLQKEEKDDESP